MKIFTVHEADGRYRIYCPESKMVRDRVMVVHGPWCITEKEARRWWLDSEMAYEMRAGPRRVA